MAYDFPDNPFLNQVYVKWRWNGTEWILIDQGGGGGGGIPEAPNDGRYYVRYEERWENQDVNLLMRYALQADSGNFDTGFSYGAYVNVDGGDFNTGTSTAEVPFVDGGDFDQ